MVPVSSSSFANTLVAIAAVVIVGDHNIISVSSSVFQNGDSCGVTSRDFMNYDYRSDYMVAGSEGCTIGGSDDLGTESGCFCAPNLEDGEGLGEWEWQCNNVVNFGPNPETGKVCPSKVPVPKGLGELKWVIKSDRARALEGVDEAADDAPPVPVVASVGTESQQQQLSVPCNLDLHPTGRPGDEVCPYSDCDDGGEHSAICACIDLEKYGMGTGTEWVCMHATCQCEDSVTDTDGDGDGAATVTSDTPPPMEEGEKNSVEKEEGTSNGEVVDVSEETTTGSAAAASLTLASTTTTTGLFVVLSFSMLLF
mmetsp:Transcript_49718/g.55412  ORF Transcript_49718/g.55412 Transcript_49718/m.55412 type:complete len:310 (+) Transcript_49718:81-1010(+)